MKKIFNMIDLDCANCAQKMEDAIRKIEGVKEVSVNFLTQKMTFEAEDALFDAALKKAVKACRKVEPDCEIVLK